MTSVQISGGRLLARSLKANGVDHVSMLHGGHLDAFWDACLDERIRLIDTRHEQAAAHLAEGWAWATGLPGVAAVTAGPGVTDAVTGLVNANASLVPMLLLGGRIPSRAFDTRTLQDLDLLPMLSPYTKLARTVLHGDRLPEYVNRALTVATRGRPGPVFLDVTADQLSERFDDPGPLSPAPARPRQLADVDAVDRAADALRRAQRPVIVAGSGVHWSGASQTLVHFVESTRIPVGTHAGGRGTVSDDHELCLGSASPAASGATMAALTQADVILAVGARFNFTLANGRAPLFAADATVIRLDIDPSEPTEGRVADIELVGDAGAVLEQLLAALAGEHCGSDTWWPQLEEARAAAEERQQAIASEAQGVHPLAMVRAGMDVLGREGTVCIDGGEIQVWSLVGTRAYQPGHWLTVGPLGTLGVGIPFAMAAKLARPNEPVVLFTGDGAFGLNAMEIETAVRHDLPLVCVIANDRSWGMSRHGQGLVFGYDRVIGTELPETTAYDQLAEALGGVGFRVDEPDELRPTIEAALECGQVAVVDVRTDRSVLSPMSKAMAAAGATH